MIVKFARFLGLVLLSGVGEAGGCFCIHIAGCEVAGAGVQQFVIAWLDYFLIVCYGLANRVSSLRLSTSTLSPQSQAFNLKP